jgi:hypothetical protein
MEDYKTIFNKIKEEHTHIHKNIKLVGDSMNDPEALSSLRQSQAELKSAGKENLTEKQKRLQQTLAALDEGLQNHFALEARYLPPFLGELLMRALILEHREIEKQISVAKSAASNMELEGSNDDDLISREAEANQAIDELRRQIEEHSRKEEIIVNMLYKGLKDSGRI